MLRTIFLLTLLTLLMVAVGGLVGGRTGMLVAFGLGLALNFVNYWFSGSIVLKLYGARVLAPGELEWIQEDVRGLTQRAGLPMPKVAFIDKPGPNAFATGRNPDHAVVAVTRGLLEVCDRRQVRAVLAHELGHVQNRDMLTMTLVAGAVSAIGFLSMMARWGAIFGGGRDDDRGPSAVVMLVVSLLAPLMAVLVQMAISRAREYEADRRGGEISGDPLALADALESLHRSIPGRPALSASGATAHMMIASPFFGTQLGRLFSTHPDPAERIRRLRAMAAGR